MKIAYVLEAPLHEVSAPALRVASVATALSDCGHEVDLLCLTGPESLCPDLMSAVGTGVHVKWLRDSTSIPLRRRLQRSLRGDQLLVRFLTSHQYDQVIGYGTLPRIWRAIALAVPRERRYLDVVEWYSLDFSQPDRAVRSVMHDRSMRTLARHFDNFIVISEFLAEHFAGRARNTLIVPPVFDEDAFPPVRAPVNDGLTHFAFAGTVGANKDSQTIRNLLIAHRELRAVNPLRIHLVGPSPAELLRLADVKVSDLEGVTIHGRLPRTQTLEVVARCHFSVLQRPDRRYARAGFPSKVVESWMLGVPVVANHTSDLQRYLRSGENGILVDGPDVGALAIALTTAIERQSSLDRVAIRNWANQNFGLHRYACGLSEFVAGQPHEQR